MIHFELNGAQAYATCAGLGADPLRRNLGYHVGDDPQKVTLQRARLVHQLQRPIVWMDQTHSTTVRLLTAFASNTDAPLQLRFSDGTPFDPTVISPGQHIAADGIMLDTRGLDARTIGELLANNQSMGIPALAVMTADCLPVVFSSNDGRVVAAVHAGRVGLENGILSRTVQRYQRLGIEAGDLSVVIGPAICGSCYEVPEDMVQRSEQVLPQVRSTTSWGTTGLDLPRAAQTQLHRAGVEHVSLSEECTYENSQFHSYRANKNCGRQALIIAPQRSGE